MISCPDITKIYTQDVITKIDKSLFTQQCLIFHHHKHQQAPTISEIFSSIYYTLGAQRITKMCPFFKNRLCPSNT